MTAAGGPRFDESLASVARELHVWPVALVALAGATLLFAWLERRGRRRWAQLPAGRLTALRGPYRESSVVTAHLERAPMLVRAASFGSLLFGHLFAPLILLALAKYPFDGIAIPLVPGIALVMLNWSCAWLLLGRSRHAAAAARSGAVGSLMANIGLLGLAAAHFVTVELQRRDGIEHACSSSVTFVVIVFAVASVVQALVTMAALRNHEKALATTD
jgi:hypothetical protein